MQLICLSCILMMSAQCSNEQSEPEPTQETWELTYDDYHVLLGSLPQYQNLTRKLTVVREGNRLSIKGIFPEYPDAWVKCNVWKDSVFIKSAQIMKKDEDGAQVYFLWGYTRFEWYIGNSSWRTIYFERARSGRPAFVLTNGGREMHPVVRSEDESLTFWYSDSEESFYYDEWHRLDLPYGGGSGFPDVGFMVNMVFRSPQSRHEHKARPSQHRQRKFL